MMRVTLWARVKLRKLRLPTLSRDLGIPIPALEAFVKGTAMLTPDALKALTRILWGEAVTYRGDDSLHRKNGESFVPEIEPSDRRQQEKMKRNELKLKRDELRMKHFELKVQREIEKERRTEERIKRLLAHGKN